MPGSTFAHAARFALLALALTACSAAQPAAPVPEYQPGPFSTRASSADTASWRASHPRDLADLLEGRFPGVDVTRRAGGGISVRVRGASSALGTEPLYVLDGSPVDPGPSGILPVEAEDVQRIEVLRGPAATGAWGSRGVNGVIVLTTRRR